MKVKFLFVLFLSLVFLASCFKDAEDKYEYVRTEIVNNQCSNDLYYKKFVYYYNEDYSKILDTLIFEDIIKKGVTLRNVISKTDTIFTCQMIHFDSLIVTNGDKTYYYRAKMNSYGQIYSPFFLTNFDLKADNNRFTYTWTLTDKALSYEIDYQEWKDKQEQENKKEENKKEE